MGYYGRLELKLQARKMRGLGKSYREIIHALKLSKSTVSDWSIGSVNSVMCLKRNFMERFGFTKA